VNHLIWENIVAFAADPQHGLLIITSLALSLACLLAWKRDRAPTLLYAHLFFLISPLVFFAFSINCSMSVVQGLLEFCAALLTKFILYILPPLMVLTFVIGYFILPYLYQKYLHARSYRSLRFEKLCKRLGIKAKLFIIDRAEPIAFALRSSVFVSVGMFEQLTKKELEAVFLHELYHVKSRSSWHKFSTLFASIFSPVARFAHVAISEEEKRADAFAVKAQKTHVHLLRAKKKAQI
jgi:Zn-dependent protease with chaperone function